LSLNSGGGGQLQGGGSKKREGPARPEERTNDSRGLLKASERFSRSLQEKKSRFAKSKERIPTEKDGQSCDPVNNKPHVLSKKGWPRRKAAEQRRRQPAGTRKTEGRGARTDEGGEAEAHLSKKEEDAKEKGGLRQMKVSDALKLGKKERGVDGTRRREPKPASWEGCLGKRVSTTPVVVWQNSK